MTTEVRQEYRLEKVINRIVEQYQAKPTALIMILQDIQSQYRYLPREALDLVADNMNLPLAQVYGVATFYRAFSLKPKGRHHLCVCTGTACHVRQARVILECLERDLDIKAGETTADGQFSIETVNCLGACALGPLVTADEKFLGNMTVTKVGRMLKKLEVVHD